MTRESAHHVHKSVGRAAATDPLLVARRQLSSLDAPCHIHTDNARQPACRPCTTNHATRWSTLAPATSYAGLIATLAGCRLLAFPNAVSGAAQSELTHMEQECVVASRAQFERGLISEASP
eukprot:356436-Chlamydomonas_euryale.AAC.2